MGHVQAAMHTCRWEHAQLMPGAGRLLWHLHSHGIPMGLATSTSRASFERKMAGKAAQALTAIFQVQAFLLCVSSCIDAAQPPTVLQMHCVAACMPPMGALMKRSGKCLLEGQYGSHQCRYLPQTTRCGDEVENGKPAPDCFRAAAERMGVPPAACLVIEDAPSGVAAATAAGMRVIAVPSIRDKDAYPAPDPACTAGDMLLCC